MPVVAVVAGAAGAWAGASALAAGAVGLAAVSAGLAVVGGVTTALGAITGNKKLQKFGMIAGVGALAAGGIAALSNAGSTAASTGTGLAANAAGEGLQAGAAANTGLSVSGLGGEAAGASFGSELGSSLSALNTGGQTMAPVNYSLAGTQAAGAQAAGAASAAGASAPVAGPAVPQTSLGTSPVDSMAGVNQAVTGGSGAGSVTGGAFDKFTSFLNNNKELTKLGTGLLSGASQGYMADETAKRQQRAIDEQRARFNASISGQTSRY